MKVFKGFWDQLTTPIIGLSPMDGVTDHPYRHIQKKYGQVPVVYTEFTSVEGVCHNAERLLKDFLYDETQRPIVAQIYGTTPDFFRQTATLLCELGFDGIDINMGCPAKNVAHSGAGAALIETPQLAQEIIVATMAGVEDWVNGKSSSDCADISPRIVAEVERRSSLIKPDRKQIPVSVKTRVGYNYKSAENWIPYLIEKSPAVIAVHGRTLKQRYTGEADWAELSRAAELVKNSDSLFFGNGDITSYEDALQRIATFGGDGALIGRASFGNPYVFLPQNTAQTASLAKIAVEHAYLFEKTYRDDERFNFLPMRKHLGWYIKGMPGAAAIRKDLFTSQSAADVEEKLRQHRLI